MNAPFFRIAPEGVATICVLAVAGWLLSLLGLGGLSFFLLLLFGFTLFFFRDPLRTAPTDNELVISPSDGRVIEVVKEHEDVFLRREVMRVSVFLSIFDPHVNWFPISGEVADCNYSPGKFTLAFGGKASKENERLATLIKPDGGKPEILMVQVAGFVARRIVSHAPKGARLKRGERFGIIKFGSRIDLFIPEEYEVRVRKGDEVRGAETTVAVLSGDSGVSP